MAIWGRSPGLGEFQSPRHWSVVWKEGQGVSVPGRWTVWFLTLWGRVGLEEGQRALWSMGHMAGVPLPLAEWSYSSLSKQSHSFLFCKRSGPLLKRWPLRNRGNVHPSKAGLDFVSGEKWEPVCGRLDPECL